jgi:hypothetical protein
MRRISKKQLEQHREKWIKVSKRYGWYQENLPVQVWVDKDGDIVDSITHRKMGTDRVLDNRTSEILDPVLYELID